MFRTLLVVLLIIFLIPLVLPLIRSAFKLFDSLTGDQQPSGDPKVPLRGELKRDPVCGTYVSSGTDFTKLADGQKHYFCSATCRDKFQV